MGTVNVHPTVCFPLFPHGAPLLISPSCLCLPTLCLVLIMLLAVLALAVFSVLWIVRHPWVPLIKMYYYYCHPKPLSVARKLSQRHTLSLSCLTQVKRKESLDPGTSEASQNTQHTSPPHQHNVPPENTGKSLEVLQTSTWMLHEWLFNEWLFNEWMLNEWMLNKWMLNK